MASAMSFNVRELCSMRMFVRSLRDDESYTKDISDMPDSVTPGDGWVNWIIVSVMSALASAVGTIIALARVIDGKYREEISDLKASMVAFQNETLNVRAESRADRAELWKQTQDCHDDRVRLSARLAMLEQMMHDKGDTHP